ncbi:MAG: Gfo/Idh/MocA family protein [Planctomycetota bacterium]|jgi:predicted dehydrogenase
MSRKRYEIGVIGCGKIWEIGHWRGLKEMPDEAHVRCVFDTEADSARKAAEETGAALVESADAIFDDEAVDIVAICTPPFARVDYVERACAAGKHLMLEKPMARTVDQALAISGSIREAGVKCFIPFARALGGPNRELAKMVRAGAFGEPRAFVHTNLGTPYSWVALDHWMHDQDLSGGPIFDYSIHYMELARACLGEAREVLYGAAATTGRVKSDDQATLLVWYAEGQAPSKVRPALTGVEEGRFGEFTKSWSLPPGCGYGHQTTHVVCADAVIVLGKTIEAHTSEGKRELDVGKDAPGGRGESYRNLIAAIEDDVPLHASELEGLRMNEILDAMERSRASGRKERVTLHERP